MKKKVTPMMEQYMALKENYKDCIIFYRLGDFYEMFFDDAITASKELEITLTGRDCGLEEKAPMCGVPHHSAESYINRLIAKGYKVAIAEQVEDVAQAKGIVKRDVVRILTPGANINMSSLDEHKNNYLMCIYYDVASYSISYVDLTTGDFYATNVKNYAQVLDEIAKIMPSECIIGEDLSNNLEFMEWMKERWNILINTYEDWFFDSKRNKERVLSHFHTESVEGLGMEQEEVIISVGALLEYLYETQKSQLEHIQYVRYYEIGNYMLLDMATRRNLELLETMREKEKRGSLLWVLDSTKTAMGARKLRNFIEQPLCVVEDIKYRLEAVEELYQDLFKREEIRELLAPIYDIERLMTKITLETANPRDMLAFLQSISLLPKIKEVVGRSASKLLLDVEEEIDELMDIKELIVSGIEEDPPISLKDGKIIRKGYNEDVDRFRRASLEGKQWLAQIEAKEKEATGIKNLKIKYNKVFGYYLEVSNANKDKVPERYIRKQTLTNAERYITPELKEIENSILGAQEKLIALEYELFTNIRKTCANEVKRIKKTASAIALLDAIQSLATVSAKNNYVKPTFNKKHTLDIKDGRHPVIEKIMGEDKFITNNTLLDNKAHRFSIITGPNMAGKSTYMRQVALINLMAQIGSFVPASSANIAVVDRIFTRVGASDDLASGKSTFMVEMSEVANILRNATSNSLVILDEIGRGTSTFDGLSIAWAVVEYISDSKKIGAKTLFATHYHELTELEGKIEGVENYCITVKEQGDDIIFLRKIAKGGADKSYGIQVAKIAGVPDDVIKRSKVILEELSEADIAKHTKKLTQEKKKPEAVQLSFFDKEDHIVIKKLKKINPNNVTPLEALTILSELKNYI